MCRVGMTTEGRWEWDQAQKSLHPRYFRVLPLNDRLDKYTQICYDVIVPDNDNGPNGPQSSEASSNGHKKWT